MFYFTFIALCMILLIHQTVIAANCMRTNTNDRQFFQGDPIVRHNKLCVPVPMLHTHPKTSHTLFL